jgi:putative hydroxymethylpyrimidine transport system substrate-binding protein
MKEIILIATLFFNLMSVCYAAETQKLRVLLDWFANPNHAPLFVAEQQGFFKEQGLDVELIGPADPTDPPKLVAAGKADIAITYEPQFIEQVEQGLPLVRIGTLIDQPLNCLVVLKESAIHTVADLKAKKVGYSTGGVNSIALSVMLKKFGLSLNDVEHINVHYDLTQALLSKKVDAVTGMMRNFELLQMEIAGHPGRAFYPEQNGVPNYSELIFVAKKSQLQDPRLAKFLIALQKGVNYLKAHPEESWKQFVKTHPELNDELNRRAWVATLPYFTNSPASFDKKSWLRFAQFMQQNGLIKKAYPIEMYAVTVKE